MDVQRRLLYNQILIFVLLFVGYALYILCRKGGNYVIPYMVRDGLSKGNIGLIATSLTIAYAVSKFVIGIISDKLCARTLFAAGLGASGLATIAFSYANNLWLLLGAAFLNGIAQGCGWVTCTKLLQSWFSPSTFGTFYSLLASSMNISGSVVPLLVPTAMMYCNSWRDIIFASGFLSVIWAVISLILINNCPEDNNLPALHNAHSQHKSSDKEKHTAGAKGWKLLLSSPFLWVVSASYFIVFGVKTSFDLWGQLFIVQEKGLSDVDAAHFTSSFEVGGLVSTIVTGFITDFFVKQNNTGSPRMNVACFYNVVLVLMMQCIRSTSHLITLNICSFWTGAAVYGNIVIFGILATEMAPPHLSGASHAIAALMANGGALLAGWPASQFAKLFSLNSVLLIWQTLSAVGASFELISYVGMDRRIRHSKSD